MLRVFAGITGLGLIALPVLAQVRSHGDDANAIAPVEPATFRFYRVGQSGRAPQQTAVYMDADSIQRTNGTVRGWETVYYNYQDNHLDPGARIAHSLIEANCRKRRIHFVRTTYYTRSRSALNTVHGPHWYDVIPDSISESIYQFLCEDRRLFDGAFDPDSDARRVLPPERAAS
jgi:hypothetical protein